MLQSKPLDSSASDMEFGMVFNSWEKQSSNAMNQGTGSHKWKQLLIGASLALNIQKKNQLN